LKYNGTLPKCAMALTISIFSCKSDPPPEASCSEVRQRQGENGSFDPSGVELCTDGTLRRSIQRDCFETTVSECSGGECRPECDVCSDREDIGCACIDTCKSDDECNENQVCLCYFSVADLNTRVFIGADNGCYDALCKNDADCKTGEHCNLSTTRYAVEGAFCTTPTDECSGNLSCGEDEHCMFNRDRQLWSCRAIVP
jgi:hypothetical protein